MDPSKDSWATDMPEWRIRSMRAREERRRRRVRHNVLFALAATAIMALGTGVALVAQARTAPALASEEAAAAGSLPVPATAATAPAVAQAPSSVSATSAEPVEQVTPAPPAASAPKPAPPAVRKPASTSTQRFKIAIGRTGYEPSLVSARATAPITLVVGKGEGCAAGFSMPALHIVADNSSGPVTLKLGKLKPGTYRFTCGMGMVEGRLVVR